MSELIINNFPYRSTTRKIEEISDACPIVDCPNKSTRQFDGLSYFGGILTICGIAAIAFVGIKLFQSQKIKTEVEDYNLM
jgi:hypothetical protein